jgi:hypothetical protein
MSAGYSRTTHSKAPGSGMGASSQLRAGIRGSQAREQETPYTQNSWLFVLCDIRLGRYCMVSITLVFN